MNRIIIASEILKIAKELMAMEFDTEEEKKKYQQEHEVRPGTKLTVKKNKGTKSPTHKDHTHTLKDGTHVRVYDSGGDSDRYTAVLDSSDWDTSVNPGEKAMLGFSGSPDHPQGVSQFSSGIEGKHLGKPIKFMSLPKHLQDHVHRRVVEESGK